ncbi:hypothetical protein [Paenibacillus aestuarii]|uniref:Uncharacterized protein n=1 Tax=Paenibacillus aestuarii TaxID=516965 RepID=A0ABW0KCA1_9BACL|nr:hypothetical protein [Paenibacillus aestuarii]
MQAIDDLQAEVAALKAPASGSGTYAAGLGQSFCTSNGGKRAC